MNQGFQDTIAILKQIQQQEMALPVRNEACQSKFFLHPHPTAKVCLFLHGFTAGPYQFVPISKAFFEAGYNVLVPLQPGHGRMGDWNRHNPPPLPTDIQTYQEFAVQWLQWAQTLGEQVVVGGLSTGGALAAWLAMEHSPCIDRALLFTPFLGSRLVVFDYLIQWLPIYFEWFNKNAPGNFGYQGFRIPALRVFLKLGQQLLQQSVQHPSPPVLVVCSESDRAVNLKTQQRFFQRILNHQPHSWYYCFDNSLNIEHRMMTRMEDNDYEELVIALAKAFVESDLPWVTFQQLASQIVPKISEVLKTSEI